MKSGIHVTRRKQRSAVRSFYSATLLVVWLLSVPQTLTANELTKRPLMAHADAACPLRTSDLYGFAAGALQTNQIDLDSTDLRVDVELTCYQLSTLEKQSYALLVQIENPTSNRSIPYRLVGVLPNRESARQLFLTNRVKRTLNKIIEAYLATEDEEPMAAALPQ